MPNASVEQQNTQTTDAAVKAGRGHGGFGDSGCKAKLGPQDSAKPASPEHSAGNACLALRSTGTQSKLQASDPSS